MINVYYGSYLSKVESQICEEPVPVIKTIVNSTGLKNYNGIFRCPAITDFTTNLYQVLATYDYELHWDQKNITSPLYSQPFFDNYVLPRDIEAGLFSYFDPPLYLFAECDTLDATVLPVMFEKKHIDCITLPGTYDIANHFRKLESALIFNKPDTTIKIKSGMPLYYIKFNTKEKINLIRFNITRELWDISETIIKYREFTKRTVPLQWYYSTVRKFYKKKILKIIKQNILN